MRKLFLYWDSFRRLSPRQRYYWFLNRWVKPLFSIKSERQRKHPTAPYTSFDKMYFQLLTQRLHKLVYCPEIQHRPAKGREISTTSLNFYFDSLRNDLGSPTGEKNMDSILKKRWLEDVESEEFNNYQRFHLFDRMLKDVPSATEHAISLIDLWISLNSNLPSMAFDTLNCAVRLMNWIKLFRLITPDSAQNEQQWRRILGSMAFQASRVHRNIEYEIGGNHVLLELFSLWLTGSIFPELEKASEWVDLAEREIPKEIYSQFGSDAFHCEHSLHYHIQCTIICMHWLIGMQVIDRRVNSEVMATIQKACYHIDSITLPDQSIPVLGDKCYSFFTARTEEDLHVIRDLSSLLFSEGDVTCEKASTDHHPLHYYVHKNSNSMLVVDVGNIGCPTNPGHGHSDLLSFVYCCDGIPIFIDPGTRSYSDTPDSLDLKKAVYHNTLSIDSCDQAQLWGYFRWALLPDEVSYEVAKEGNKFTLTGRYRGFKQMGSFRHERMFEVENDRLTVKDKVHGTGTQDLYFNVILHPKWNVNLHGDHILLSCDERTRQMIFHSKCAPDITVNDISVYQEYKVPTKSNRITVLYRKHVLPFCGKMVLLPEI